MFREGGGGAIHKIQIFFKNVPEAPKPKNNRTLNFGFIGGGGGGPKNIHGGSGECLIRSDHYWPQFTHKFDQK